MSHPRCRTYIFFSNLTILFNKWLIDTAGFRECPPAPLANRMAPSALLANTPNLRQRTVSILQLHQKPPQGRARWLILGGDTAIFLTCWHMIFSAIATQILARTTRLLDGRKRVEMTGRMYMRVIMPIGLFYSGSLVCSNLTYLYLSVPFIQMLKVCLSGPALGNASNSISLIVPSNSSPYPLSPYSSLAGSGALPAHLGRSSSKFSSSSSASR